MIEPRKDTDPRTDLERADDREFAIEERDRSVPIFRGSALFGRGHGDASEAEHRERAEKHRQADLRHHAAELERLEQQRGRWMSHLFQPRRYRGMRYRHAMLEHIESERAYLEHLDWQIRTHRAEIQRLQQAGGK